MIGHKNFALALLLCPALGCLHKTASSAEPSVRLPATQKAQLPDHATWDALEKYADELDFSRPGLTLTPSNNEGTSIYAVIFFDKKIVGAVIPENSSTVVSGEIMTFHLARALGVQDLYQPAFYHFLKGKNLQLFQALVTQMPVPDNLSRAENKRDVEKRIQDNPGGIPTVFKKFGTKPQDYDELVDVKADSFNATHVLPGSSVPVGAFLKCAGPQPKSTVTVKINGGKASEADLARQLSSIFLIDALTQEWDRFSGGNLQTLTENGVVKFISFDNGGTWSDNDRFTSGFLSLVTRFDPVVAQGILDMDLFFKTGQSFRGLKNEKEFLQAMGIEAYPQVLSRFKKSLSQVAAHIRKNPHCNFQ